MTEEESQKALFNLHQNYMSHTPKERVQLYSEYIKNRNKIKEELKRFFLEEKNEENKTK